MAENLYLELAIDVACERYNLDEQEWTMFTFTDGAKAISVGLEHTESGAKVRCSFPREEIRFEEMKRWSFEKKLAYVRGLTEAGKELDEKLVDSFHDVMLKLDLPTTVEQSEDDTVLVEEETAEQFEKKVGKKFKRKAV